MSAMTVIILIASIINISVIHLTASHNHKYPELRILLAQYVSTNKNITRLSNNMSFLYYRLGAKPIYSKSIKREPRRHESYPVENWIYQTFRGTNRYFIDCEKQFAFNCYHSGELKPVITKCAIHLHFFCTRM